MGEELQSKVLGDMKKQALLVALFPLFALGCGGMEDTQSNPKTQTTAALSSNDPFVGTWCLKNSSFGCFNAYSSGYAYQQNLANGCWYPGDQVYANVVSTGTDANGNPTYSGTRNFGGSPARCYDANLYSATFVIKTNPDTNQIELTETIQSPSVTIQSWIYQP